MSFQPFDFNKLPRLSKEEARLINEFYRSLPLNTFSEGLQREVEGVLTKELGDDFSLRLERVSTEEAGPFLKRLPPVGVYLILGLVPLEGRAFAEVDLLLAHTLIDKVLGGDGEPLAALRPLAEIEEGVLQYLVLKVLSCLFERCGRSARIHFRLEGIRSSPSDLTSFVGERDPGALLTFKVRLGDRSGYLRLLFPSSFLRRAAVEPMNDATAEEAALLTRRFETFGFIRSEIRAEVGWSTLTSQDLEQLKAGDVILLEHADASVRGGHVEGGVTLKIGRGRTASYQGEIVSVVGAVREPPLLKVKLGEFSLDQPVGGTL